MDTLTFDQLPKAVSRIYDKLQSIKQLLLEKSPPQADTDEQMTVEQAAKFLDLSVSTVYGKVCRSEIPVKREPILLKISAICLLPLEGFHTINVIKELNAKWVSQPILIIPILPEVCWSTMGYLTIIVKISFRLFEYPSFVNFSDITYLPGEMSCVTGIENTPFP